MPNSALSVIIPTQGLAPTLPKLVRSLEQQRLGEPFEVVFVENFSNQIEKSLRSRILTAGFRIESAGAKGANRARNLGLSVTDGPVTLFLDDDCEAPHAEYFAEVLNAHRENPEVCAIGGRYILPQDISRVSRAYQLIALHWIESSRTFRNQQIQLLGGAVSYKRDLLDQKSLKFNPNIEFGGAESDFHDRLFLHDLRAMLDDRLSNIHHCFMSLGTLLRKGFLQGQGHVQRRHLLEQMPLARFDSSTRPTGWLVALYDLAFRSGEHWSSARAHYEFPSNFIIYRKILGSAPQFFLYRWGLDKESLHWRRISARNKIYGWGNSIYWNGYKLFQEARAFVKWRTEAAIRNIRWKSVRAFANVRGQLIDVKWRLLNFKNDLRLAWRGYGNHRVFEKFKLVPLTPSRYYTLNEVTLLSPTDLLRGADQESTVPTRPTFLKISDGDLPSEVTERFVTLQSCLSGIILNITEAFDFRKVLPIWNEISVPVYLHVQPGIEQIDRVYDEVKNLFYMAQQRLPKEVYSSCLTEPSQLTEFLEEEFVKVSATNPLFSIVIPAFNNDSYLPIVLDHLAKQKLPADQWEAIIVDDGSDRSLVPLVREWSQSQPSVNIRALRCGRKFSDGRLDQSYRAGRARNCGVQQASGKYLLFLDSDILVSENLLNELSSQLVSHDVVQLTRQMVRAKPVAELNFSSISSSDLYSESTYWESFKRAVNWADLKNYWKYTCTYGLAISREDFHLMGQFKARFTTYGFEDVDLGYRLSQMGRRFLLSKSNAYHMYPKPTVHSCHFDYRKRQQALRSSCREFYLANLDPEIYRDLYTVIKPSMARIFMFFAVGGELTRRVWKRTQFESAKVPDQSPQF